MNVPPDNIDIDTFVVQLSSGYNIIFVSGVRFQHLFRSDVSVFNANTQVGVQCVLTLPRGREQYALTVQQSVGFFIMHNNMLFTYLFKAHASTVVLITHIIMQVPIYNIHISHIRIYYYYKCREDFLLRDFNFSVQGTTVVYNITLNTGIFVFLFFSTGG